MINTTKRLVAWPSDEIGDFLGTAMLEKASTHGLGQSLRYA